MPFYTSVAPSVICSGDLSDVPPLAIHRVTCCAKSRPCRVYPTPSHRDPPWLREDNPILSATKIQPAARFPFDPSRSKTWKIILSCEQRKFSLLLASRSLRRGQKSVRFASTLARAVTEHRKAQRLVGPRKDTVANVNRFLRNAIHAGPLACLHIHAYFYLSLPAAG